MMRAADLYLDIIQNAGSNSRLNEIHEHAVNDYIEGIISATARLLLDVLRTQGRIENFTVTWARTNGVVSYLLIQVQETAASQYAVYKYPREQFSREIIEVAGIMMS